jgi:hypothetical protein
MARTTTRNNFAMCMLLAAIALLGVLADSSTAAPGSTSLVSVDRLGNPGNGFSGLSSINADGRYVVFYSSASNLVQNDTNNNADIFVRDMHTGTTELASVDSSGNPGIDFTFWPSISADRRYVAFGSRVANLVENDTNETFDVFVRDLQEGPTEPNDDVAPTTTACGHTNGDAPYEADTWTNQDVRLTFSARDNHDGSGVEDIRYSATGAQS